MRNASYASHRDKFETGDLVNTSYRSCVSTYVENFHYVFIQFLTPYKYGRGGRERGGRNVWKINDDSRKNTTSKRTITPSIIVWSCKQQRKYIFLLKNEMKRKEKSPDLVTTGTSKNCSTFTWDFYTFARGIILNWQ